MKHARKLVAEPTLLAQYRATYPNEELRPPSESTPTWNAFKTDQPAYAEVLERLALAQQGLCLYCEQRLVHADGKLISNDYQVEHVQPKSGAVGRVLDWVNLALACLGGTYAHHQDQSRRYTTAANTSCGQTKLDAGLPTGCDPRGFPLLDPLVEVGIDGMLSVNAQNCAKAGVTASDVTAAIALLNLDCERLRMARQGRRDNINTSLVQILAELTTTHLGPDQQRQMLALFIAGRLQPDGLGYLREFWTTERSALSQVAEGWLSSNQGLFI